MTSYELHIHSEAIVNYFIQNSIKFHMTCIWSTYETLMQLVWSSYEDHMKFICNLYEAHTCLPVQISCQVHMKFRGSSYKIDMKFRWIAYEITYEFHMNICKYDFMCTSFEMSLQVHRNCAPKISTMVSSTMVPEMESEFSHVIRITVLVIVRLPPCGIVK